MKKFFLLFFLSPPLLSLSGNEKNYFTENKGQVPFTEVKYIAKMKSGIVYFTDNGFFSAMPDAEMTTILFETDAKASGEGELNFHFNYYYAHCPQGITHVKNFRKLVYKNFITGMDMTVSFDKEGKLDFIWDSESIAEKETNELLSINPWSSFCGGSDTDESWGIATDSSESMVVTGYTYSLDFPLTPAPFQDTLRGGYDAFVLKTDSSGNLQWATYYGSTSNDFGQKVKCGTNNCIVVTGYSSGTDFPVSPGCWQPASNGSYDAFILKFDSNGIRTWATYFGGSGGELSVALDVDAVENILIGGSTSSTDLPVTAGCLQSTNAGPLDAFIAKFTPGGNRIWSTYFGGSLSEDVHALAFDDSSNIAVVGGTYSSDLPFTPGAYQTFLNGTSDIYVLKLDSAGVKIFCTYFGGIGNEDANGVVFDTSGNIYFTGFSNSFDFPANGFQTTLSGTDDSYIAKLSPLGNYLWSTFFGGSGSEAGYSMDYSSGNVFITGTTTSTDLQMFGFQFQPNNAGSNDCFVLKVNLAGWPYWSTYFGGTLSDLSYDIAVVPSQKVCITGSTYSTDFPVTFGSFQQNYGTNGDGFISCMDGTYIPVSVPEILPETNCIVYPNPFSDYFILESFKEISGKIKLFDLAGREAGSKNFCGNIITFERGNLSTGLYIYKVESEGRVIQTGKIAAE